MSYLSNDKSYNAYRLLFDFVVADYHVDKTLALTFTSTDGLKSIKKILSLKFVKVREKLEIKQPLKWSDSLFRGYKDGIEMTFKDAEKVYIDFNAVSQDKEDVIEVTVSTKEEADKKLFNYLS
jgi:hypothetical protein